jgi:acylphosphatase
MRDGNVEIVAEGEEVSLQEFLAWCRHGPPHARVTDMDVDYSAATGEFDEFEISY